MSEVLTAGPATQTEAYVNRFKAFLKTAIHEDRPWITQLRKAAMAQFVETGLPTTQQEDWRFTSIAPLLAFPFIPVEKPTKPRIKNFDLFTFGNMEAHRLVFIDGHYSAELSAFPESASSLQLGSLRAVLAEDSRQVEKHLGQYAANDANAFVALNTAFFQDGAFVFVPAGETIELPVHLLFISTAAQAGSAAHVRNLIMVEKHSTVSVIESYVSLGTTPGQTNTVTEIVIGPDAKVEHCKVQDEGEQAFHFATVQARQAESSLFRSHSISLGARLARNQIESTLDGEGAECLFNGLYLGRGEQLVDHHTVVNHAKPHCESHEFYHGILDGRSHGVFNGKIFVQQDAQKTNAKQTNRNLLLSEDAIVDTKPQLEIFADDVKCTHGATIGQLNEEAVFYLRSRGIGMESARRMLIHAFAREIVDRISVPAVKTELEQKLTQRFAQTEG